MCRDRKQDNYEFRTSSFDELMDEVVAIRQASRWERNIDTSNIKVSGVLPQPIFAEDEAKNYGVEVGVMRDLMETGSGLLLQSDYINYLPVRDCCISSISERSKISGSALNKIRKDNLATIYNHGFSVQTGRTMVLTCYDMATALHSEEQYEIMEIPELLDHTVDALNLSFDGIVFVGGYNSHSFTQASWIIKDKKITNAYKMAIRTSTNYDPDTLIPAMTFTTSNTSNSAVRAIPSFKLPSGSFVRLFDPIEVPHRQRDGGMQRYQELLNTALYSQFYASIDKIQRMSKIKLLHGPNVVVSLCKAFNIPKRYGDIAREVVVGFTREGIDPIAAHDVYFSIADAIEEAELTPIAKSQLHDKLARVLNCDWADHDVGGVVAWS